MITLIFLKQFESYQSSFGNLIKKHLFGSLLDIFKRYNHIPGNCCGKLVRTYEYLWWALLPNSVRQWCGFRASGIGCDEPAGSRCGAVPASLSGVGHCLLLRSDYCRLYNGKFANPKTVAIRLACFAETQWTKVLGVSFMTTKKADAGKWWHLRRLGNVVFYAVRHMILIR